MIRRILWKFFVVGLAMLDLQGAPEPGISDEKVNNGAVLWLDNPMACPVTATVHVSLTNMSSDKPLPLTVVVPAHARQKIDAIHPSQARRAWSYHWDWHWLPGDRNAHMDPVVQYELPFPSNPSRKVIQGFHGKFSHFGPYEYAIDWAMPVGSLVLAARDGVVVAIRDDSTEGGKDRAKFEGKENFVQVLHSDGTIGCYVHLKFKGALVELGRSVHAGDPIAYSGNTGWTSQPHLHFHVQIPIDGDKFQSLPIRFRVGNQNSVVLLEGQHYPIR
jgi:hypothetical protein